MKVAKMLKRLKNKYLQKVALRSCEIEYCVWKAFHKPGLDFASGPEPSWIWLLRESLVSATTLSKKNKHQQILDGEAFFHRQNDCETICCFWKTLLCLLDRHSVSLLEYLCDDTAPHEEKWTEISSKLCHIAVCYITQNYRDLHTINRLL